MDLVETAYGPSNPDLPPGTDETGTKGQDMNLNEIRDENGKLPPFAWPGGYEILYLDSENSILCADCANSSDDFEEVPQFRPVAYFVFEEGVSETCTQCNREIESAYGDPEEVET